MAKAKLPNRDQETPRISHFQIRPEHLDDISCNLSNVCQSWLLLLAFLYIGPKCFVANCFKN